MSLQIVYSWSKKIHRWMMWVVLLIGSGMMFGGLIMHQEIEGKWYPSNIDTALVREMHNNMAIPFSVALGVMMLSGLLMWAVPKILQNRRPVNQ